MSKATAKKLSLNQSQNLTQNLLENLSHVGVHQVYTGTGTGSGFLIDDRHLLTNCHVVEPFREVAVERRDRSRIHGVVRRVHPERDLAIVELSESLPGHVLELGQSDGLRPKQAVHILGFPVGLPLSLTEGVISRPSQLLDDQFFVQTDAAINPGNSGGPILDAEHRVIAVTTCKLTQADAVGFGIPVDEVKRFIEGFRQQQEVFAAQCPACEALIVKEQRYCTSCGMNLDGNHDIVEFFAPSEPHPLVAFVELSLARAGVNPVLARHGENNWTFRQASTPIKIWCCCSEHLNVSSTMALISGDQFDPLYRYLLDQSHAPFGFDLSGNIVRMNHVVHISDVFGENEHDELAERVKRFISAAGQVDNRLIREFGCKPAPESFESEQSGHMMRIQIKGVAG